MAIHVSEEEYARLRNRRIVSLRMMENPIRAKSAKYHNEKVTVGDFMFDSKAEAARYAELRTMEQVGLISELRLQVPYEIEIAGKRICKYIADFAYMESGNEVVEDVKGVRTPVYRLKKKLVEAVHGVRIKEVTPLHRKG